MAVDTTLRITELDYISIRENIKTFLSSQEEFQDYNFEGSGLSILLDVLAYNTHYMGVYVNMVGNEAYLDTAQIRSAVVSIAKHINYTPGSRRAAKATINVAITPSITENQVVNTVTLDKYTRLLGSDIDGVNHQFVTLYSNTATKSANTFSFSNVHIIQGEVVTRQLLMSANNTKRMFEIPSANVDTDTMVVTVQESSSNTDTHTYTKTDGLVELTGNSKVYFLEENDRGNFVIQFGDGYIGYKPRNGNIVIVTYLDTIGITANNIREFTFVEPIGGLFSDNVAVTTVTNSYGSSDRESIEDIRFRAPYYYKSQGKAVTEDDYAAVLVKDFSYIDSVSVWGGEKNDPIMYGKVFIAIKPKGNYFLTNLEKETIKNKLVSDRTILTVVPEIEDPDYGYLIIKGTVYYDSALTSKTSGEILTLARAAVYDYNDEVLGNFNSTFKKSQLQNYIEDADKSITSSEIDVYMQKQVKITTGATKTYEVKFHSPIRKSTTVGEISTYPTIEVYDASGVPRDVIFEEKLEIPTSLDSIEILDGGSGYLTAPTITITGDGSGAAATATIQAGRVVSISLTNAGSGYTSAGITITSNDNGSGAVAKARLSAEFGTLRSVYYDDDGERIIVNDNAGTIEYSAGKITLTNLKAYSVEENSYYREDYLAINAPMELETIKPTLNRIILIDEDDSKSTQLEAVADSE